MPPTPKERLDKLIVARGLCDTRAQAQALIMDGKVRVDGVRIDKAGTLFAEDVDNIDVDLPMRYVSRGGLKLEKALQTFKIDPAGRQAIDVGASTGGFTDCLLQNGASFVYAVDVGHGQIDWSLRQDTRVCVLEKTNIRDVTPSLLADALSTHRAATVPLPAEYTAPSLGVIDASFISLVKTLPPMAALMAPAGELVALLKPQFEYRDYFHNTRFKGVVRDPNEHRAIIQGVLKELFPLLPGWQLVGLDASPITGPKGNVEFLLHFRHSENPKAKPVALPNDAFLEDAVQAVLTSLTPASRVVL